MASLNIWPKFLQAIDLNLSDAELSTSKPPPPSPTLSPSLPATCIPTGTLLKRAFDSFPRTFQSCHINAQSLLSHFPDFSAIFNTNNLHCIAISETWLKPSLPTTLVALQNYQFFRNDRTGKRGGGVGIYCRSDIKSKIIAQSDGPYSARPEFLIVEMLFNKQKLLVAVVYRPPKIGYMNEFETILLNLIPTYEHIVVFGDFNTNLLNNSPDVIQLTSIFNSCNMTILPLNPTNHTITSKTHSHTLIDLIVISNPDKAVTYGQLPVPSISTHDLIYLSYSLRVPKAKPKYIIYRDLNNINEDLLKTDAYEMPWNDIYALDDINSKVDRLNTLILSLYDRHAPEKQAKVTRPPAPWMTEEIRSMMARRDASYRRYKQSLESANLDSYKFLRNKTKQLIRNSKLRHMHKICNSVNSSGSWQQLRSMGIGKAPTDHHIPEIALDDLNNHFTMNKSNLTSQDRNETINNILHATRHDKQLFTFHTVTTNETYNVLKSIQSKAKGFDGISINLIHKIIGALLPVLTHIFNHSLKTGTFPCIWKQALVRPIPKKSSPILVTEYRPISILPSLSKALERIVHRQITAYLNEHLLLDPLQSGFRTGHSTETALLKVTDDIRRAMDSRQMTILTLLDYSSAFDSVDIPILLAKLQTFNFHPSTIHWFSSYFNLRTQCTVAGDLASQWRPLQSGVPQGSVLGPLLFSLYINDLPSCLKHSHHHLYADDLQIYYHTNVCDISKAIEMTNNDLNSLTEWSKRNALTLNPNKTQTIIVGYPKLLSQIREIGLPPILLNNVKIPFLVSVKNLGVTISESLSWFTQISLMCKRIFSSLHSLKRLRKFTPVKLKIKLIQTLILPLFDYCDTVLNDVTADLCTKLQRAQNACIRYIFDLRYDDHLTAFYLKLSWLRLNNRRKLHVATQVYKLMTTSTPDYLASQFRLLSSYHNLNTRAGSTLAIPLNRTSAYSRSFLVAGSRLWNSLPARIRESMTVKSFKKHCYDHLLNTTGDT